MEIWDGLQMRAITFKYYLLEVLYIFGSSMIAYAAYYVQVTCKQLPILYNYFLFLLVSSQLEYVVARLCMEPSKMLSTVILQKIVDCLYLSMLVHVHVYRMLSGCTLLNLNILLYCKTRRLLIPFLLVYKYVFLLLFTKSDYNVILQNQ